jgi:hypothetical protein
VLRVTAVASVKEVGLAMRPIDEVTSAIATAVEQQGAAMLPCRGSPAPEVQAFFARLRDGGASRAQNVA